MDDTASRRSERSRSSKFCQNFGSIVSVTEMKIIKHVQKGSLSTDSTLVRSEELSPFDKSTGMISPPLTPPRRPSPEPEHAHEPYPPNMLAIISMLPKNIQEISQIEQLSPQTIQLLGRLACYLKSHTEQSHTIIPSTNHYSRILQSYDPISEGCKARTLATQLASNLAYHFHSHNNTSSTTAPTTEQLLLTALYMFTFSVAIRMKLTPSDRPLLELIASYAARWDTLMPCEEKLLIWVTLMSGAMGGECMILRDELTCLVDGVLGRARGDKDGELCLREWRDVEGLCEGFFWIEPMARELRGIWVEFVCRQDSTKGGSDV